MTDVVDIARSRALTAQFYEWEQRGRGWLLAEVPVHLEAPFYPFLYHSVSTPYTDDGKRPTLLSKAVEFFRGSKKPIADEQYETPALEPFPYTDAGALTFLTVAFPRLYKVRSESMEQLLVMLSSCKHPLSFEIIASHTSIAVQLVCRERDKGYVQSQVSTFFPDATVTITPDRVTAMVLEEAPMYMVDFGLQEEFMRPLAMAASFDYDQFIGLFGILEHLGVHEHAVVQVLFSGTVNTWTQSILTAVSDGEKGSFFLDAPEMPALAHEKVARPLFGVTIRVVTQGKSLTQASRLLHTITTAFITLSTSKCNALIPLSDESYTAETRLTDVLLRQSHRVGMLLNARELATFAHFPSASITSDKLVRDIHKTKASPGSTEPHQYVIGLNEHQGKQKAVTLSTEQRLRHMHIIGATGTGKSTLLLNLISQDIKLGNGIAVLDPHGDLIESILPFIPEKRINDVIVIDPFDSEYPVSFNILTAHSDIEKEILSSDLVTLFRRFSTSWGDQMNSVFANAILAMLESTQGGTLVDLRRFLIEKPFREQFLATVTDPEIVYYWQKEYPLLKSGSIGPILTRLDTFLRPKLIRNMVSQKQSLDFEHILNAKKIVLVKLSQGLIGAENSFLLGALIVSKLQQAAMARQAIRKDERADFFLYIDEFHQFITPSMTTILTGARKYHLGLVLSHQDMQQVVKSDSELSSSLLANAGTRICFRVGESDAKKFEDGFASFVSADLQNLSIGQAIARVNQTDCDFSLTIPPVAAFPVINYTEKIIARSREKYARKVVSEQPQPTVSTEIAIAKEPLQHPSAVEPEIIPPVAPLKTEPQKHTVPVEIVKDSAEIEEKKKIQSKHRYLQTLIKKMAEERGFKASLEVPTKDGKGKVDIVLERDGKKIAVEISVTTDASWELHNIQKCLADGYEIVVACSSDQKTLATIQKEINKQLSDGEKAKVVLLQPESLYEYLDKNNVETAKVTTVKGYRVKVNYNQSSKEKRVQKSEILNDILLNTIRK